MASYPGDLTPERQAEWIERFQSAAEERWGADRLDAISGVLRSAAIAAGRLDAIQFVPSDFPGFFMDGPDPADGPERTP